ncbi:hypothetical protein DK150_370067 [Flavobacterium psychrophilum]|uniref:BRO-N domain-containing protein n=1 Tax=Flavobacterium psychrophilum TaxID=96345 RepID=UPI000B7C1F3F|nr:BRO family protein [Flavobacterium psychrophilum]SNA76234.1 hypothetical protein DK150_370067 [Flavobacterium psychrophilum]
MEFKTVNFENNEVRITEIAGVLWFIAVDLSKIIEHKNINGLINRCLDDDEKQIFFIKNSLGKMNEHLGVSESGYYKLMIRSNMPKAKIFVKWLTSEVIPQIRKTGNFGNNQLQANVNQLGTHKENLKFLKNQSFELNKKIRHEKMKIDELELLVFVPKLDLTQSKNVQTDLFSNENKFLE